MEACALCENTIMSNPNHSPLVEAKLIVCEATRRAYSNVVHNDLGFVDKHATKAYRRDVANRLAGMYHDLCDKAGFDYLPLNGELTIADMRD